MADPSSSSSYPADEVGSGDDERGTDGGGEGGLICFICGKTRRDEEGDEYCRCAYVVANLTMELLEIMNATADIIAAGSSTTSSRTDQEEGLPEKLILERLVPEDYNHPSPEEAAEECGICLAKFKNGDVLGRIKCMHKFHFDCIKRWLVQKNTCPNCKGIALAV